MKNRIPEQTMDDQDFERLTIMKDNISLIMEFPKNTLNDDLIAQDIRDILKGFLMEYEIQAMSPPGRP